MKRNQYWTRSDSLIWGAWLALALILSATVEGSQPAGAPRPDNRQEEQQRPPHDPRPDVTRWANQSSLEQLEQAPGIGPVLAARILSTRLTLPHPNGRGFTHYRQLLEVKGIGPKRLVAILQWIDLHAD